jgi:lipopolysaccharide/colanic/teichoic acid biosynthesis glycosyltransferase
MIRLFDIFLSLFGIIILSPIFLILMIIIHFDSPGTIFYRQIRIGKNGIPFTLLKFRTMKPNADKLGLLTIGSNDLRITRTGIWMRRYKLDELPQLFNVLIGEMSFVGPRPEVKKYVEQYTREQKEVLSILPGITDLASIVYSKENEILATQDNPEEYYMKVILPDKIILNLKYVRNRNILDYYKIILKTIAHILNK